MSVDEPQFSDDPDEGPEEAEATIASSLEGIDIAKNKGTTAEETKAQPNRIKKNKKLTFEDESAKKEELIEDEDVYEIWLLPVDKEARNKVDRAKVTNALTTELKAMYNLDQNNAEKLIINLSAQEVRGATNTFSILCLTAEVEVDIRLSLEETALKVKTEEGETIPFRAIHSPRSTSIQIGRVRQEAIGAEIIVYLDGIKQRTQVSPFYVACALNDAGLVAVKGPRRLPERGCGIESGIQSNRYQIRCVPAGFKQGDSLQKAMTNYKWPCKLLTVLKYKNGAQLPVRLRYGIRGEHANPPIDLGHLMTCCHQPEGSEHHPFCPTRVREERQLASKRGREQSSSTPREDSGEKQSKEKEATKKRKCPHYERGRCLAQDQCHMAHTATPIETIPCNLPQATEEQRRLLGMSSCEPQIVCARGGPSRCKYNHAEWNAESYGKALKKDQEELKRRCEKKRQDGLREKSQKAKNSMTAPQDTQEKAQRRNLGCAHSM